MKRLLLFLTTMAIVNLWAIVWFILVILLLALGIAFFSPFGISVATKYKPVGEFIGAFATPVIAIAVGYIAWRQHINDSRRLRLEAYDKLHPVYLKIIDFLNGINNAVQIEHSDFRSLADAMRDCEFLFDRRITLYLDELWKKTRKLHILGKRIRTGKGDITAMEREQEELWTYVQEQIMTGAKKHFRRYLALN